MSDVAATAYCVNHPGVEATGACEDCKKAICTKCTKGTLDGFMCPPCAHKRYARRRLATALKVGGVLALVGGVAVFGLLVIGRGSEKTSGPPPPADASMDDIVVDQLRKDREKEPCDRGRIRKLVTKQNELHRFEGAIDDANAYLAKCDDYPRLRWDLLYALQQLGRHPEAIKQETLLIAGDPYDPDFWWWRAEDRGKAQQPVPSLADYRQSFANSEDAGRSRFAAARILDVVEAAGLPCEGVMAMDFFVDVHGGQLGRQLQTRTDELESTGNCMNLRGSGEAKLPSLAKGPARVDVVIRGVKGRFQIDERCGTTAITKAFAAKAGVEPVSASAQAGVAIDTVALGAIRSGTAANTDLVLGGAKALAVDVALVDELPEQLDGVIGLSLLWRFELERRDDGGLTLLGR